MQTTTSYPFFSQFNEEQMKNQYRANLVGLKKMLAKAGLDKASSYYLNTPFDDYFRHEIDPQWRGETPMTLLIDKNEKIIRKTGPINFVELKKWFAKGVY